MVVSLDHAEKNAKLSLRQTEILASLSTIVGNICAGCPEEYASPLSVLFYIQRALESPSQPFIQNMDVICWNRPQDLPTLARFPISYP